MVSQEIQTLSSLLTRHTGLIGQFPNTRPREAHFVLQDGAPLCLVGFQVCHKSIVAEPGQKKVACFAEGVVSNKTVSLEEWRNLTESANAVLFTKEGQRFKVEVLKRVSPPQADNKETLTISFEKTGMIDWFIPCRG